jgi:hypothetical protein
MEFVSSENPFIHRRHVVKDGMIGNLHACVRRMTGILGSLEDDQSAVLARRLGGGLMRIQLIPLPMNQTEIIDMLLEFDQPSHLENIWGREFRDVWEKAMNLIDIMEKETAENPLRSKIRELLLDCCENKETFRILCSRHHQDDFIELLEDVCPKFETEDILFQRETQYREMSPFDRLIRVGPMKSRGLARVPDAIFNAPRFKVLEQVLWDVSRDENDLGMEPLGDWKFEREQNQSSRVLIPHGIQWLEESIEVVVERPDLAPDSEEQTEEEQDIEFNMFGNRDQRNLQEAALFEVSGHGFSFQRPRTQEWSLAVDESSPFRQRRLKQVREGMYIALYRGNEAHRLLGRDMPLGKHAAEWKNRLRKRMEMDRDRVVQELRQSGISIENLEPALDRWRRRGVVPAPQRRSDFKILLRTLGLGKDRRWLDIAWEEIRVVRGDRMQQGILAHELVDEALERVVGDNELDRQMVQYFEKHPEIPFFSISLPEDGELKGRIDLHRVHGVEQGFRIPANLFDRNLTPEDIEQWRE